MNISRTELEQMARDGRGRTSVIKELAQRELSALAHSCNHSDSVQMRGRWLHYLTRWCQGGGEVLRIVHTDKTETEVELK